MSVDEWKPVRLGFQDAGLTIIKGPHDALHCLANSWPEHRGLRYIKARSTCRAALDGRKTIAEAHREFVAALEEARIHLQ